MDNTIIRSPIEMRVPCDGCVACCQKDRIYLKPSMGDDPRKYVTQVVGNQITLLHKGNGDCVYLDRERGCTIWNKRPVVCREFDCRAVVKAVPENVLMKYVTKEVIERGKQLLATEDIRRPGYVGKRKRE